MRDIPEDEYKKWAVVHSRAAATINGRQDALDKAAEIIERDLFLLGATAIGVPETIYTLQQAGIKVWVLTGDRQETAINIGLSCRLISESMSLVSRPIQERSCRPVPGTNTDFSTCRSSSTKTLLSIPRTS
jgi:phospholipid-transporting ATPase